MLVQVSQGAVTRSTAQATHSGSLGAGAARSSLHLHRPLCGAGASMGPSGVPRGSPVSPGLWDGWHPARWPAPSRGSTEMSREEQAGCCPHHRRPPCESSLSGPALTPCPRPLASTSSQMQWALRHPTPPLRRPPAQPQSRGTPVGFPGSHTSPDLISWPVSLWDDWGVSGRPVSGVQWAESGRGAGIGSPFLAWGEWLELLQPQSPHL